MKNYKLLLTGLLVVGLAACGRGGKKDSSSSPSGDDKNLVSSEDAGSPSVDDKSQSSSKTAAMAFLGAEGVGIVLSLWGASKVEKLAAVLHSMRDPTTTHINQKLLELAHAKRNYETVKATLANDVNGSMTPELKTRFEALNTQHSQARASLAKAEMELARANTYASLYNNRVNRIEPNVTHNAADFEDLIKAYPSQKEANEAKAINERVVAEAKEKLAKVESQMTELFKKNAKLYPVYRRFQLAKIGLQRVVLTMDAAFSKMFRGVLMKLIRFHSNRVSIKLYDARGNLVDADDLSAKKAAVEVLGAKTVRKNFNVARITYITASGFLIVGAGYTLWTTLSDAETDGNNLVLGVKDAFEGEDSLTMEEAAEQSNADAEDAE